jgi:hypothetical protein
MKRFIALALACEALTASAYGEPKTKTQLVAIDGKIVESIRLRDGAFYSTWVIDTQNVLYRDAFRDYYLVTLKEACEPLIIRRRAFAFHPGSPWQLKATSSYELRPFAGAPCEVAKIARIDDARAAPLRDASLWRAW